MKKKEPEDFSALIFLIVLFSSLIAFQLLYKGQPTATAHVDEGSPSVRTIKFE